MSRAVSVRPFSTGDFPELDVLHSLIRRAGPLVRSEVICEVVNRGERLPVHCIEMGTTAPQAPAIGFFGGVHGVERIGTQVLLAYLHSLIERLHWDESVAHMLNHLRLVFVPLVNPGGMVNRTRSNPNGVDLMRNAPVDADRPPFLLGGHRYSTAFPWFRGQPGVMETEAKAVCKVVEERLLPHRFSMSLDCHSGFGARDRIWFPYARTQEPIDCLAEIYALRSMFRTTHPYHSIYTIEPQAHNYTTHGDLWDYLYGRSKELSSQLFIPFTLEMGSWLWLKKNPMQVFSMLGMFNPVAPHRHQRILRQHMTFFDFLIRAALSHGRWRPEAEARQPIQEAALAYWYKAAHAGPKGFN